MSDLQAPTSAFFEEEVVTGSESSARSLTLQNASSGSPAAMSWPTSNPASPTGFEEAPFHISHTNEPSFKPMVFESGPPKSDSPFATTAAPAFSSTNPFAERASAPAAEPPKPAEVAAPKPRSSIGPRVAIGGVPLGVESLLKAVKAKDVQAVQSLLKQGMNPNAQNEENQTALHLAVLAQSPAIVKLLLACPVLDPNMLDIAYNTPLHIAAVHSDPIVRCTPDLSEMVPIVPASAPNSPTPSLNGTTAPSASPASNMLVPAGTERDNTGENDSPMEAVIRLLCADSRIDVNVRNASLHTPIIYPCLNGNYKVAALLVRAGASVNVSTHTDIYPLHAACENGYANIVRLLLLNGANVNVRDYQGYTPLHLAARGNFGAICSLLWRHRADINAITVTSPMNPMGKRPADLATDPEIQNFLSGMKTSSSHPLEINFVTHQVLGKSRIGMTMCPGRNKKDHRRNLKMDIATLLQVGTQVLVTLVQQHELDSMKIPDMMTQVRAAGIEVIHAPIKDKWIPSRIGILVELVDLVVARVKLGKCITVHCNGGKGRTGLVVAGTLVALGMEPGPATDLIRVIRPGMLYNPAQIVYLRLYQRTIAGREGPGGLTSPPTELAVFEPDATAAAEIEAASQLHQRQQQQRQQQQQDVCSTCDDDDDDDDEPASAPSTSTSTGGAVAIDPMVSAAFDPFAPQTGGDVPPTILSPAPVSRVNLIDFQNAANEQEKQGQPDLPVGEQHAFAVNDLLGDLSLAPSAPPSGHPSATPTESLI